MLGEHFLSCPYAEYFLPGRFVCVFIMQTVAVEGSGAAILGAPLVGYLAEHSFGYLRTTLLVSEMPEQLRVGNADALAAALAFLTVIPWSISFILYGLLHFTYGQPAQAISVSKPHFLIRQLPLVGQVMGFT